MDRAVVPEYGDLPALVHGAQTFEESDDVLAIETLMLGVGVGPS